MMRVSALALLVVVLGTQCTPTVYEAPVIEAKSDIFVNPLEVKITARAKEIKIRYSTDGSEPSTIYWGPIQISKSTTVRARAYIDGKPASGIAEKKYERVEPLPGDPLLKFAPKGVDTLDPDVWDEERWLEPGVICDRYSGDWDKLPDVQNLRRTAVESDTVGSIGLFPATDGVHAVNMAAEGIALWFGGEIPIESTDVYVFELTSDDGAKLWIDDQLVVDNDGLHSSLSKLGRVALGRGIHAIEVGWFNKTGAAELSVRSAPLGAQLATVEAGILTFRMGIK